MSTIDKQLWDQILERKAEKVYEKLKAEREAGLKAFNAKHKKELAQITKLRRVFQRYSGIKYKVECNENSLLAKLSLDAVEAGLINKKYRQSIIERYDRNSRYRPEPVKDYVFGQRGEDGGYLDLVPSPRELRQYAYHDRIRSNDLVGILRSSGVEAYVDLANKFLDLKFKVELSDNENAKALIDQFVAS